MAPNYEKKLTELYAGVGKAGGLGGGLVDQEGWDYWGGRLANGENITDAFNNSAATVYAKMGRGDPSPYAAQNKTGWDNMQAARTAQAPGGGYAPVTQSTGSDTQGMGSPYYAPPPSNITSQGSMSFGGASPVSDSGLNTYNQNPYLSQMGADLQRQFNENLTRNTLPGIRSGATMAGQYGGSRQGIAEGLAMAGSNQGAASAITNLYGQDFQNAMNRNLQKYQGDQTFALGNAGVQLGYQNSNNQYDLARRGLDLGNKTADQTYGLGLGNQALTGQGQALNFYTQQRGQDQTGAALGASLYGQGIGGEWAPINQANGVYSPYTGFGNTTSTANSGGGWQGALGGALGGATLGRNAGWW